MEADAGATARRKGGKVTKSSSAMDADRLRAVALENGVSQVASNG